MLNSLLQKENKNNNKNLKIKKDGYRCIKLINLQR